MKYIISPILRAILFSIICVISSVAWIAGLIWYLSLEKAKKLFNTLFASPYILDLTHDMHITWINWVFMSDEY